MAIVRFTGANGMPFFPQKRKINYFFTIIFTQNKNSKGRDKTIHCPQKECFYSTTIKQEFTRHIKEAHNMSVCFYTEFCLACDTFVIRRKTHLEQKQHQENIVGFQGEAVIKKNSFKLLPLKTQRSKMNTIDFDE